MLYSRKDFPRIKARLTDVPFKYWWESSRTRILPACLPSGIVPGAFALLNDIFEPVILFLSILLCFLLNTLACWANEIGDFEKGVDNQGRLGPIRPVQRGDIPVAVMGKACIFLALLSAVVGLFLILWSCLRLPTAPWMLAILIAVGLLCIAAAFLYTMGSHPYGYRGLGDLVSFLAFGPIACIGAYWLYGHTIDWLILLPALAVGFLVALTVNIQNMRDLDNDALWGKHTMANILGRERAILYHCSLVIAAFICCSLFCIFIGFSKPQNYLFLVLFIPLFYHCFCVFRQFKKRESPANLDKLTWQLVIGIALPMTAFCVCLLL